MDLGGWFGQRVCEREGEVEWAGVCGRVERKIDREIERYEKETG